jgi:uncharacterized repeat protein (TIGR03803 family)
MKKIFILINLLSAHLLHLYAQPVLYGLTQGNSNTGTISKFDASANSLSAVHTFRDIGIYPPGHLLRTLDGKLYGMTNNGGTNNRGVIFSFDPSNSTINLPLPFSILPRHLMTDITQPLH